MKNTLMMTCVLGVLSLGSVCVADSIYYAVFKGKLQKDTWTGIGPEGDSTQLTSISNRSFLLFPFVVDDNGDLIASEPSRNCIFVNDQQESQVKVVPWAYSFAGDGTGTVTTPTSTNALAYSVAADGGVATSFTTTSGTTDTNEGVVSNSGEFLALGDQTNRYEGVILVVKNSESMTLSSLQGTYYAQAIYCAADGAAPGLMPITMNFNGDGTGFARGDQGISDFTYTVAADGSFSYPVGETEVTRQGHVSPDSTCFVTADPDPSGGYLSLGLGTNVVD